jgi:bifunctional enzyme CysN/CysC
MARELIGKENFVEVFINTPLALCEERDPKGLYKKARSGRLPNMTGVDSPYEAPLSPDLEIMGGNVAIDPLVKALTELIAR